jgi:hypothetical protein
MSSTGTFHLTLHNKTATNHSNMKEYFLLSLEILIFDHEKPAMTATS